MFKSIDEQRPRVNIRVDGRTISAQDGEMLALALLQADILPLRHTAISGQRRAPFCLMGVCFDCLVQVNDRPNIQSCMVTVNEGMNVQLHRGAPLVKHHDV